MSLELRLAHEPRVRLHLRGGRGEILTPSRRPALTPSAAPPSAIGRHLHEPLGAAILLQHEQLPPPDRGVSKLADNINAESVLGTVRNREEGVPWCVRRSFLPRWPFAKRCIAWQGLLFIYLSGRMSLNSFALFTVSTPIVGRLLTRTSRRVADPAVLQSRG